MQVKITNVSTGQVYIPSLYKTLEAAETITFESTRADIDRETTLKDLVAAGSVTLTFTEEADDNVVVGVDENQPVRVATTSPVIVLSGADRYVICKLAAPGAVAVTLPASPSIGDVYDVIDGTGDASVNNITVSPNAGTISGAATLVISLNYGAARFVRTATEWLGSQISAVASPTGAAGGSLTGNYPNPLIAVGALSANVAGRARMATGYFDAATVLDKFGTDSMDTAELLQVIKDGAFAAADSSRALFAAGFLGNTAAGRALMATGWFDVATALSKFATDSLANAWLIQAIADGSFQADANTRALFADGIWTQAKLVAASLNGIAAATVADVNVVGGLPVVHRVLVAAGADLNIDVLLTYKTRVLDSWFVLKGAGTAGGTITVKNVVTAITEAYDMSAKGDKFMTHFASIDDAQHEITAGTNLRVSSHSTGGDFPGAEVYVMGIRVA